MAKPASAPLAARAARGRGTPPWIWSALALAGYALLALFSFRPITPWSSGVLPRGGVGDPAQMVWFLAYTPHAITHGLNPFSTNLIDYPTGVDLANNTSVPLLGLLGWPVTATLGPVATFNLLVRLGIALSAASMYLVLGRWCRSDGSRFVGGLLYGFGPYVIGQTVANTHLNLLFVPLFPLLVAISEEVFVRQRWRSGRAAVALGLAGSAQMLIEPELLSDFLIVAAVVVVYLAVRHPAAASERAGYAARALAGALGIFVVVSALPIYEMVAAPGRVRGAIYPVTHLQAFRNTIGETLIPTMQQALTTARVTALLHLPTKDPNELGGYLSVALLAFLAVAVVVFRRHYGFAPLAVGALAGFVLSLGATVHVGRTTLPLPESVLARLPLLESTIPSRFSLMTALCSSMILAFGIEEALRRARALPPARRRALRSGLAVTVVVIVASLAPRLPIAERELIWPNQLPGEIAAHVPRGGVLLAYPYPAPPFDEAMAWQAVTGFPYVLLGGYATVPGPHGTGQEIPATQRPVQVQRHLGELEFVHRSPFPRTTATITRSALCTFLAREHVTDIVVSRFGARESVALSYLESAPHRVIYRRGPLVILSVGAGSGRGGRC